LGVWGEVQPFFCGIHPVWETISPIVGPMPDGWLAGTVMRGGTRDPPSQEFCLENTASHCINKRSHLGRDRAVGAVDFEWCCADGVGAIVCLMMPMQSFLLGRTLDLGILKLALLRVLHFFTPSDWLRSGVDIGLA
jgi:hypothetical protein